MRWGGYFKSAAFYQRRSTRDFASRAGVLVSIALESDSRLMR